MFCMSTSRDRIGHTYFSGNTFCPKQETLEAVGIEACDVPAAELRWWSLAYSGAAAPSVFVRVSEIVTVGLSSVVRARHIPTDVWDGTRFDSADEMVRVYVSRQGPVHDLPGTRLPGGR
jgi:hypothetical protein